jgi:ankyrin repeat protein
MNNKQILNRFNFSSIGAHQCLGVASALFLAIGTVSVTSCGRKSQAQEDVSNLKLVGYELDQTGFFKAVENDDLQALTIFKARGFDLNDKDLKGRSATYVAAEYGSVRALNFLAKYGADIEATDLDGVTPLMAAARAGKAGSISYLLDKGASARLKDNIGKFPLIHAMDGESDGAIHLLAAESREMLDTGLLYAADMDKSEVIPVLVHYGASVYARNSGKTSLMIAAERGNDKAVKALLDEGANLYAVSDDGRLAKDFADGNERVLKVLVNSEAETGDDALALEWSEDELEALIQKAMDRSVVSGPAPASVARVVAEGSPSPSVSTESNDAGVATSSPPSSAGPATDQGGERSAVVVTRIQGKSIPLELTDNEGVNEKVSMAAYAEKSLPIQVRADDVGRVEVYDLRENESVRGQDPVVGVGSQIGMTGLRVKAIKKKVVNNKLTGGRDKELVTLMIEDEKTGQLREIYAGYESQAVNAVAVLKVNETGEHLVVERDDEFYDLKGSAYKVMDVNDEEVIIENIASGELSMLPLMGVKR